MATVSRVQSLCRSWASAAKAAAAPAASRSLATSVARPSDVGVLAMEMYVPHRYVAQTKLEQYDGVSAGKYTVGLGQKAMAFVDDREDINSIAMTAVQRLLDNYGIDPKSVGRLEIGTESLVDKSKSSKTTLMDLFPGNRDIEGATTMNACYGGTAALFNSAAWVESSEWDGRYAIYVAADIAVYEPGPARPTGGCGAIAVLVGPNAPLRLVPRTRTTHAVNVYDFYKPSMSSEYPAVDGKLSQACYLRAVDDCYSGTLAKVAALSGANTNTLTAASAFDHLVFHSPYNKLVQQSFRRMLYNDARRLTAAGVALPPLLAPLAPFAALPYETTLGGNKDLDKAVASVGAAEYAKSVGPSEELSKSIGNSYTGATHANLLCLASTLSGGLAGKRVGAFSYGSGAIATMFAVDGVAKPQAQGAFTLERIAQTVDVKARLAARREAEPAELTEALKMREATYGKSGCTPTGSLDHVPAGAYYLDSVKPNGARVYGRK